MDPKATRLYDAYLNQSLDRCTFLGKLAVLAGGTTAAFTLLSQLEHNRGQ